MTPHPIDANIIDVNATPKTTVIRRTARLHSLARFFLGIWILALLAGCNSAPAQTAPPTPTATIVAGETITILNPIARPAPVAGGNGAIYLTLANGRNVPVQLVRATSSAAATVQIHETVQDNSIMRMQHLETGISIPAGSTVALEPGGLHIMLMELAAPLAEGETVDLTLYLESQDPDAGTPITETVVLDVQVGQPDDTDHSH